jgi:diadenosine tetraphosphate (Ap4A) HIT family hydrolase
MSDCPFCAIVAGEAPASVVHEGDRTVAFLDLHPANPGHTLVVPREHADGLADLPAADGERLFAVGQRVAAALRETVDPDGVNLFLADGEAAGQEVFHVHLHVVPRHEDDDVVFRASPREASREELDEVAGRLRSEL